MSDPQTNDHDSPDALLVWDNHARLSLPPILATWLGFLVVVCLASVFFVRDHTAARWVLGGFIASHVIVFTLPAISNFTIRRGFVSLVHVIFWSPGLITTLLDTAGRQLSPTYAY